MKGYIIYPTHETINDETIIQLYGRLENGQSFVTQNRLKPYFYIKEKDLKKVEKLLSKYEIEKTNLANFREEEVVKISAKNQSELNKLYQAIHKKADTYEADIRPNTRFLIDNSIMQTIKIEGDCTSSEKIDRIYNEPEITTTEQFKPKLKIASIDTESSKKTGQLYCIGLYTNNEKKVLMITKHKLNHVISCKNEVECLEKFKSELLKLDPDIITGWNLINFDLVYLKSLYIKNKIPFDIGRNNDNIRLRIESGFFRTSNADATGRQIIDALSSIKDPFIQEAPTIKNAEFESYTLEDVSQAILNKGKLIKGKFRHEEIEDLYKNNTIESHQKLADYNLKDCELVFDILEKTKMIDLAIERSQLTGLPLDRITGSIAAFDSLYLRKAKSRCLVCPTTHFGNKEERITGGFVQSLNPGIYHNVLILDFKSLYPSIIKTFNIDPASYLEEKEKNSIEAPNKAYFKNTSGILPEIITTLHEAREKAKKEKRELSSYAIKIIMNSFFGVLASPNCRFFNLKIANAITHFGQFILKLTAQEIEKLGYKVIYEDSVDGNTKIITKKEKIISEEKIEKLFTRTDTKTLGKEYNSKKDLEILTLDDKGNSVFKPIKYIIRHKCNKKMYRIHFTNNWHIDVTEDHSLMGYQSLAFNNKKENISNPLKRIIELKPREIWKKANTIVSLKKIPNFSPINKNYPKEIYEFMGYFIGDGSFCRNKAHQKNNKDYYLILSLGLDKEEILNKMILPLQREGYIKNFWQRKTRRGDLTINGLKLINLIANNFRDKNGKKNIPDWLFEETDENIASFLRGLFSADGCVIIRNNAPIIKYTSIENNFIEKVRKLLYRVGISHSIFKENSVNKYKSKEKIYGNGSYSKNIIIKNKDVFSKKIGFILDRKNKKARINTDPTQKRHINNFEFDIQAVKKIELIQTPEYVYDIEVDEIHKFFANYVLVHNTDSTFVESALEKEKALKLGVKIQEHINNFYKDYVKDNYNRISYLELEFEKLYLALMIPKLRGKEKAAKKRYAGLIEKNGKEEIEITGLEAIRGDWTEAAQEFQKELLLKLFKKEPLEQFIKSYIKKIKEGKLDLKLIYRKSIRKSLEEYTKTTPPHVKAARQLEKLESNIIEYYQTVEGPEPIQKLRHKIDYNHYIEKQIAPIANQVLILINKSFEDVAKSSKQTKLF